MARIVALPVPPGLGALFFARTFDAGIEGGGWTTAKFRSPRATG